MIAPRCVDGLTWLAIHLTAIAIFRLAPRRGRQPEPGLEGTRKCLRGTKTNRERYLEHRHGRLADQSLGGEFQSAPSDVIAERLPHPRGEQPVKVKLREIRDDGERPELQRLIEVLIDVLDNPVHSGCVLGAAVYHARFSTPERTYVETSNFSGFHSIPSAVGPAM